MTTHPQSQSQTKAPEPSKASHILPIPFETYQKIQNDIQTLDPGLGLNTEVKTYPFSDTQNGLKFATFHGTDVWIDVDFENVNHDEREENIKTFKTALLNLDYIKIKELLTKNDAGIPFIAYKTREDGFAIRTIPISHQEMPLSNPLPYLIKQHIKIKGPMSLFDFWAFSQYFPALGFYDNRKHFDGHFMTASMKPETDYSVGIGYMISEYAKEIPKEKIRILELGPGTGNNMFRILSTLKHLSDLSRFEVVLVETGEGLQSTQKHKLQNFDVRWVSSINDVKNDDTFTIILGDEVIDSFPYAYHTKTKEGYKEILLGTTSFHLNEKALTADDPYIQAIPDAADLPEDSIVFRSEPAEKFLAQLLKKFSKFLFVYFDYTIDAMVSQQFTQFYPTILALNKRQAALLSEAGDFALATGLYWPSYLQVIEKLGIPYKLTFQKQFFKNLGGFKSSEDTAAFKALIVGTVPFKGVS